jgi:hypothetical protein
MYVTQTRPKVGNVKVWGLKALATPFPNHSTCLREREREREREFGVLELKEL